jgi:hypothetical protein
LRKPVGSPELVRLFRDWISEHDRWMVGEQDQPLDNFARTLTLERVLREEFFRLGGRPRVQSPTIARLVADCATALDRQPPGRQAIWRLPWLLRRLVVATVNFDQLVEDGMDYPHRVISTMADFSDARSLVLSRLRGESDCVPILKLHGSIEDADSLVADIATTSRGLPGSISALLDDMLHTDPPLTWIWVGCSMRDVDVNSWLAGKDGVQDLQEWWVDPLPPRSVFEYAKPRRIREWTAIEQDLTYRQITETADRFLAELASNAARLKGVE